MATKLILILSLAAISLFACKPKVAEDPLADIPEVNTDSIDNQSYRIVADTLDAAGNQVLDVELSKQEDSTSLRYLAIIISEEQSDSLAAIHFYLSGSPRDTPYATVQYNPEMVLTMKHK